MKYIIILTIVLLVGCSPDKENILCEKSVQKFRALVVGDKWNNDLICREIQLVEANNQYQKYFCYGIITRSRYVLVENGVVISVWVNTHN
jgi:peroxiredoxin